MQAAEKAASPTDDLYWRTFAQLARLNQRDDLSRKAYRQLLIGGKAEPDDLTTMIDFYDASPIDVGRRVQIPEIGPPLWNERLALSPELAPVKTRAEPEAKRPWASHRDQLDRLASLEANRWRRVQLLLGEVEVAVMKAKALGLHGRVGPPDLGIPPDPPGSAPCRRRG